MGLVGELEQKRIPGMPSLFNTKPYMDGINELLAHPPTLEEVMAHANDLSNYLVKRYVIFRLIIDGHNAYFVPGDPCNQALRDFLAKP
jgi:hypothetical protein